MKYYLFLFHALVFLTCIRPCAASSCQDFADGGCRIMVEANKSFVKLTDKKVTSISVANPEIADVKLVTPRQVLIIAQNPGSTNLVLWYGEGEESRADVYEVSVYLSEKKIAFIRSQLKAFVPHARVTVGQSQDGVILSGSVESQQELDRVLTIVSAHVLKITNLIELHCAQQVQLEVTIAEVSRTGLKRMGLGFLVNQSLGISVFENGSASANMARTNTGSQISASTASIASPFASAFQIAVTNEKGNASAILSILKGQELMRLLATPTLVTTSGQTANFVVGGEFPVPVAGESGQISIQFKEVGVKLNFTPTIIGKEVISLVIKPEISSLDYTVAVKSGGVYVPGVKTRKGSATLSLRDGQSFAMAGLLKEESSRSIKKVPVLGDIPVIGGIFTSKEYSKEETELVVMVTPRLVKPLNSDELPRLPGEDMHDCINDMDFFMLNRLSYKTCSPEPSPNKGKTETGDTELIHVTQPPSPVFVGDLGFAR
ncbi:type II and III secretion system protein family protein [Desulfoluna spongiiphila]|uniref:Pilus assembly protein CpaC n=1 Tax=Desulfoluna spongiiphila TaxID=419481 RepID=A0A1G5HDM9_9BACT|nr:type II and III secretion system protein family protein [Desulfoluna spongiiphila]SCY61876.1 pilus assembly protein CpaC [Desulfoluna spongiiphila]